MAILFKSRSGGGGVSVLLMIVAVLAVAGFFFWLSQTAVPTEETSEEAVPSALDEVSVVALEDFASETAAYVGQAIGLENVRITQLFGPHAFWTTLPNEGNASYLVHLAPEAVADSVPMAAGAALNISGVVVAMTDSVLDAWAANGYFVQENDRLLAEYAIDFLEATRVEAASSDGPTPQSQSPAQESE